MYRDVYYATNDLSIRVTNTSIQRRTTGSVSDFRFARENEAAHDLTKIT